MKNSLIKLFCVISLVCILTCATLSACRDNSCDGFSYDAFSCNHIDSDVFSRIYKSEPQLIIDYEQLTSLFIKAKISPNDKNDWNYLSSVYEKFRSYDKKFFNNRWLIMVTVSKPFLQSLKFGNLEFKDDTLTVNLINDYDPYDYSGGHFDMIDDYLFLIEINKKSAGNINQIKVKEYNYLTSVN